MVPDTAPKIKLSENARLAAMFAEGLIEPWDLPPLTRRRKRKPRKPSIDRLIRQAERSGKKVTSATIMPDGMKLEFGEPTKPECNDLDLWRAKRARATEGH